MTNENLHLIEQLLKEAEEVQRERNWQEVRNKADQVVALDPDNEIAKHRLRDMPFGSGLALRCCQRNGLHPFW